MCAYSQNMGSPRSKQAVKAANVAAKNRREKIKDRNKDILLAFRYLTNDPELWGAESSAAFKILLKPEYKGWSKSPDTPLRILADAHNLTRQGVHYIIKKGRE